jgi:phosphoribosylaminoimidazolecarboxamide formyltransferase/IMP cyclohydrolase
MVANKTGIVEIGKRLKRLKYRIFASHGTTKVLREAGLRCTDISTITGRKPILNHKVVSLNGDLHGGCLAYTPEEIAELEKLCLVKFDLVYIHYYPLHSVIAKPGVTYEEILDAWDVGGPSMTMSAAKGNRIIATDPAEMNHVLNQLEKYGEISAEERRRLVAKAVHTVITYYMPLATYLSDGQYQYLAGKLAIKCKYGENPWQTPAALFATDNDDPLALHRFDLVEGADPSYINFTDFNRCLQAMTHVIAAFRVNRIKAKYFAVIVKHGNAIGASYGNSKTEVIKKTLAGNPRAAWGGILITNFTIGEAEAELLRTYLIKKQQRILDGVLTPAITIGAISILKRAQGLCRIMINKELRNPALDVSTIIHTVRGGFLRQPNFEYVFNFKHDKVDQYGRLARRKKTDLLLAWALCSTSSSNTITIVNNCMLIGNGTGQDDRVGAAQLAIRKARTFKHLLKGAVCCSDSFFPYVDGPRALVQAGIIAILTVSGSKIKGAGDKAVKAYLLKHKVTLIWIPVSLGRMFYGHC